MQVTNNSKLASLKFLMNMNGAVSNDIIWKVKRVKRVKCTYSAHTPLGIYQQTSAFCNLYIYCSFTRQGRWYLVSVATMSPSDSFFRNFVSNISCAIFCTLMFTYMVDIRLTPHCNLLHRKESMLW